MLFLVDFQRDSYIETPTNDGVTSPDHNRTSTPPPRFAVTKRKETVVKSRSAEQSPSRASSPPPMDDLSPFTW